MSKKLTARRLLALVMCMAMMFTVLCTNALALNGDIDADQEQTKTYTYEAPTSPMDVDDSIITASAHRAASPILGMMGVNATSGFGMINGGAPADYTAAISSPALGVWGSSINDNPDPYYWNYFYNYYAEENGLEKVANSVDGGTALTNANVAASPVAADTNLVEAYGNLSYSVATRPDILVGCSSAASGTDVSGYDAQIATVHSFTPDSEYYQEGDETYAPKLVSYQTTYIKQMIESVYRLADAITEVEEETGKTTRYGDVQVIASDYEKYVYGIIAYVEEELAAKGLPEKTVAVLNGINEDGTYNLCDTLSTSATSLVRAYEYSMPVSKNLLDVVDYTDVQTTSTGRDGSTTTTTVHTVTKDQLLQADVIITFNNQNITEDALNESLGDDSFDGIVISNTPSALYGMTMNSVENAMGYAYCIGAMYCDELDINPVELCAYFYEHFLHISDRDGIATVVKTNFASTILPEGISATLPSTYSAASVEEKLSDGMTYYATHKAQFQTDEYALIGMDDWSIDRSVGIGEIAFEDVANTGDYYYTPVYWGVSNCIVYGDSATMFKPNGNCTRAQMVTFLYRAAGYPEPETTVNPFKDVSSSDYYYKAVLWASENNIVYGTEPDEFSPNDSCTREQAVTFLYRYYGKPAVSDTTNPFTDVTGGYYYDAVLWGAQNGIVYGEETDYFGVGNKCLRAQIITFIYRAATKLG